MVRNWNLTNHAAAYGKQIVLFVPNLGQADPSFSFVAQKFGFYVGISTKLISLNLCSQNDQWSDQNLTWYFVDARAEAKMEGLERGTGTFHYYRGTGLSSQLTNLPSYRKLWCRELWEGIDVIIQEKEPTLTYDWHIHPSGRLEHLQMLYGGTEVIRLNEQGDLLIQTALGLMTRLKPVAYQITNEGNVPIACNYRILFGPEGSRTLGFELPDGYDTNLDIVIKA
ncbi:DUF7948 domain-containing protein [Cohnella abietis]|uniref:DUF7948 domain-containing protein n=1 Tax=Cohnella abietis TaxID=2507935 RepID=A0A3T1CYX5_9BACL|nr:hypothetical protein [Cohnella abietis]BBI31034.1 hypothetical protein KCTCHS21_04330 [Cohnella abietis]